MENVFIPLIIFLFSYVALSKERSREVNCALAELTNTLSRRKLAITYWWAHSSTGKPVVFCLRPHKIVCSLQGS